MKKFLPRTLGLILPLVLAFTAAAQGEAMEVIFTPDMDKAALERIREDARESGVELSYTNMDYKDGQLARLAFVLKTKKGMGSAQTDELSAEKPFGFRYDPKVGAFSVGSLTQTGPR